jgi:hypothetical protein
MLGLPTILVRLLQKFPSFSDSSYYKLGSSYPNATGHNAGNDEAMPLEGDSLSVHTTRFLSAYAFRVRKHAHNDFELHAKI